MSRRSSGGGNGIAGDEGQRYGPEVLFNRGGVSPPRLEHEETLTAALVATFLVNYDSYKKTVRREAGDGFMRRPAELSELVDLVHQDALSMRYFDGVGNLTDAQVRTGLEKVARVKRVAGETNISKIRNDLRQELTMEDKLALCDNIAMVTGNLSRYLQEQNLKDELCPGGAWKRGAGKMVVQLLLQGMKPARFKDAVKLQLAWEEGDSDSPSKLMAIMNAQLDKFEAAEEILGVRINNTESDKPKDKRQGKDIGRVGKEATSKRNGSKTRVNVDDGVKTFWGTCFVCGEQGHKKDRCPTRTKSDKKATAQPQRSSSAIAPSAGISTGARLRAPSLASSSVPQGPASRTRSAVDGRPAVSYRTVSVETQEREEGHADQVQGRLDICLEQIEMLRTELVGTAPDDPRVETGVTMTHARKLCGVTPPVGANVSGLIPSGDVEQICVTRGVNIEERSGGAKGVDIEPLRYHCGAELVARGGKTLEPLGLQAVLDSASGVTGISERLLERLRRHFGGVDVSPLKSGPCQVSVADGRALTARYQTTDDLQVTLRAPHGRISFRVAFVILPGSDDVMIIGSKTLRESLDIDIVQAFHQRVSQVGELFAAPGSAVCADETVSSVRRLSGPGLTLKGMLQAQVEDALPDPPDKFCETLVSHGPAMFMEAGDEVAARREALVGALRVAVEVGLPEGCVAELEEIVLGECFDAFRRALTGETPARVAPMRVTLKQGADLSQVKAKPRVYPPEKSAWLKEHFEMLCETGMVYPNPQAICASVAMAFPKGPGKGYRLVADFSPINGQCELVPGPMRNPEIEGEKCVGAVAFCTMDCLQGYWQCPLAEEAREYFTFVTKDGLFTPTRVPQGVMNATSYFQGMMMEVLGNLVGRACLIYVDDVKVIGRSVEELIVNLRAVLLRCMERGLFLAAHKLVLFAKEVKWCGKLYSGTAVRHDPECVRGLVEMRRPETVGELMKFLQATNWMRLSLPHMAEVVAPLRALMEDRLKGTSRTKRVASRRALTDGLYRVSYQGSMVLWVPEEGRELQARLMVCAHMQDAGHRGVRATTHRLGAYCAWDNMEKDIAKFIRQCLHCTDSKAGNALPRPLGDLVHGTEVGDVLHFDYLSLGESDAIDMGGLIDGGYKHVLVLMDDVSRFVWLEEAVSCSMEVAARSALKWCASFGVPKAFTSDGGTHFTGERR